MAVANSEVEIDEKIYQTWTRLHRKPKCIVFDLDYTLWPFIMDSYKFLPPFSKSQSSSSSNDNATNVKVIDSQKSVVKQYESISLILNTLSKCYLENENQSSAANGDASSPNRVKLAVASRSSARDDCMLLMNLYDWTKHFSDIQIYSGSKAKHMKNIYANLKLSNYNEMLFFDDNKQNFQATEPLGVIGYQLNRQYGLSKNCFREGLLTYQRAFIKNE